MSDQRFGKLDATLIIQLTAFVAILLDIPFLRQVIGFLYLSFLPGFLVLKTIRLDRISRIENILFSIGLSLAILMFIGLLSNEIYPALNVLEPLSAFPLTATIFTFTLVFYVVSYYRNKNLSMETVSNINFSRFFPLFVCVPIMTILGTEMLISSENNLILLVMVVITCAIVLCTFSRRLVPPETYLLVVLAISLFLLFHVSLISKYIIGYDIHLEYYFANLTFSKSMWVGTIPHEYNAMLSVTILPVLFSNCLNLDLNWVFKIVYPLIFSLVPLVLFVAYRKLTNSRIALLSVFFFISMDVFYFTMLGLVRQMLAELFFALLILLIVEDKISPPKRKLLFIIFSVALIVSHYALSYVFMSYILFTFCLSHLWKRSDAKHGNLITGDLVLLYFTMAIVWYVLVSPASFNALATTVNHIVQSILAQASAPGISGLMPHYVSTLHQVSQYLFYGLQLSIVVGLVGSIVRRRETRFSGEYFSMSLISLFILIACMVVPSFAAGLVMSRFYHITSFLLAPFVVLGILTFSDLIMDLRSHLPNSKARHMRVHDVKSKGVSLFLISLLLVLFFLFQVGFVYEITGDIPSSSSLSMKRLQTNPTLALDIWDAQTPERDVFSAKWLYKYMDNQSKVYADKTSSFMVLTSYCMLPTVFFSANSRVGSYDYILSPTGVELVKDAYVYLRKLNVIYGIMDDSQGKTWNTTVLAPFLNGSSEIYTNGESEIYQNP
jgi:uncharacterized membrane protein